MVSKMGKCMLKPFYETSDRPGGINLFDKIKNFISKHWVNVVWPVVAGLILFLLISGWARIITLPKNIYIFFIQNIELQLWFLIILCLVPIGITILIKRLIYSFNNTTYALHG